MRRFSAWLAAEGEIEADELAGMKPPKLDEKVPEELIEGQVKAMPATCGNVKARMSNHKGRPWTAEGTRVTTAEYATEKQALRAEQDAICSEEPAHNSYPRGFGHGEACQGPECRHFREHDPETCTKPVCGEQRPRPVPAGMRTLGPGMTPC